MLQTARLVALGSGAEKNESEFAQIRAELDLILHMQADAFANIFSASKQFQDSADASNLIDSALQQALDQYDEITTALKQLREQLLDQD